MLRDDDSNAAAPAPDTSSAVVTSTQGQADHRHPSSAVPPSHHGVPPALIAVDHHSTYSPASGGSSPSQRKRLSLAEASVAQTPSSQSRSQNEPIDTAAPSRECGDTNDIPHQQTAWVDAGGKVPVYDDSPCASSVVVVSEEPIGVPADSGDAGGRVRHDGDAATAASGGVASQVSVSARTNAVANKKLKRSYGNVRPILGGRFVINEHSWHAIIVVVVIVIFVVLFLAGVPSSGEWWTFLVVIVFALAAIACLLLAVSLDPGILEPRPAAQEPHKLNVLVKVANRAGQSFDVNCTVCRTCHIRRPPRSTHCHFCDVCVEEFDHHCGVLGSCVGKRTFRFFAGFFMTTTVLCLYIAIRSVVYLAMRGLLDLDTPRERFRAASAFVSAAVPAMCLFLVAPFCYVYLRYSCLNWTEKEYLRAKSKDCCAANEPYHQGCCHNLFSRLCGPLGAVHVHEEYWV